MTDLIDVNEIKKLTGGDRFYKRGLEEIEPIHIGSLMTLTGNDSFYMRDLDVDLTSNLINEETVFQDTAYAGDKYAPRSAQIGIIGLCTTGDFKRYYPNLKHVGSVELQIRQPLAGNTNVGNLRLGEIERDADIEYGANVFSRQKVINK